MTEPKFVTVTTRQWVKSQGRYVEAKTTVRACDICGDITGAKWHYPGGRCYCAEHRHLGETA